VPRATGAPEVHGVVFDLDGTLVDAFPGLTTAANAARAAVGEPPLAPEAVRRMVGGGVERLVALAVGAERVAQALPVFRETYARVCAEQTDALPDARPTLEALSVAGLKAAVASNKPVEFTERILATLGLRRYLAAVAGPETAGALKPEPAMLRRCLVALGIEAAGALYVGDMPMDVIAGERAAVRVVLVGGGAAPVRELRATGATVLARLYDLVSMLGLDAPGGKPR